MDSSPLSKLPPEIRNQIYELAIIGDGELTIFQNFRAPARLRTSPHRPQGLALTTTCKQVREECVQIFYARAEFRFERIDTFALFLGKIGKLNAPFLQTVILDVPRSIYYIDNDTRSFPDDNLINNIPVIQQHAKEYGCKSVKLTVTLDFDFACCIIERAFDIVKPGKSWDTNGWLVEDISADTLEYLDTLRYLGATSIERYGEDRIKEVLRELRELTQTVM